VVIEGDHASMAVVVEVRAALRRTFGSLESRNYRLLFGGQLISQTGAWMHTMAEAWLVLKLTDDGAAVGTTFAFRFLPILVFGMWGGAVADRYDRRKLLVGTQLLSAVVVLGLWVVVLAGVAQVWMVWLAATALGFVDVVDRPANHAFTEQMVGTEKLANAVALNSAVMNSARITGPAIAGLVIGAVGTSWVFFVNALSFLAVLTALLLMRPDELRPWTPSASRPKAKEGIGYTWGIREIRSTVVLVFVVGTLVYNFPTFLTIMAEDTFHGDAGLAGLLMAALGVGTVVGALAAAHRAEQTSRLVISSAAGLGALLVATGAMPTKALVLVALVPTGAFAVFFGSVANAHMQLWSAPEYRGRVMAVYSTLTMGTTVAGGPFVGWVSQRWNARVGFGMAGIGTLATALVLATRARRDRAVADELTLVESTQAAVETA
jgi:MFS family permease